jgi:glyoxylase-like metal-dependent hydrolase (beta-lactamase superfamily II)
VRLGDFELTPLSDGTLRLDGGAMFGVVPKTLWERRAPADALNRIVLGMRPLLIRTPSQIVLVDAGAGDKYAEKALAIYGLDARDQLDASLAAAGVTADQIDLVIASHLHWDHVGGLTRREGDRLVPRFPRARHIVRRGEWDVATHPNARIQASYLLEDFVPLADAGLVDFIDDDGDVAPGISVWQTGGHTRDHQIVRIESGGRVAIFMADLIPTVAHVDPAWIMGYDLYPLDTFEARERWLPEAAAGEYVIFFEHDPVMQAGIIRTERGRYRVEPVEP